MSDATGGRHRRRGSIEPVKTVLNSVGFARSDCSIDTARARTVLYRQMNGRLPSAAAFLVVCLLVVVAVSPAAGAAAVTANDTASGALVGDAVASSGASVGTPVAPPSDRFGPTFWTDMSTIAATYNEEDPALGLGGDLLTGNVVNFHVTDETGAEAVASFRLTGENRITDLRAGPRDDASIRLSTDRATFDRIAAADAPGRALVRAMESGEVRVDGRGFWNGIVWDVVTLVR